MPLNPNLTDYRELVSRVIRERTGVPIVNGSADHASVIVQECFNNANDHIRLLSNRLDPDCYASEGVRNSVKMFLAHPAHRLEILVEGAMWDPEGRFAWEKHPFVETLVPFAQNDHGNNQPPQVQLKIVPEALSRLYDFNFLVMDDYGYRFEANRKVPTAVAAFLPQDNIATAQNLIRIFDTQLWNHSGDPRPLA
jgi:hypothetical protein